jgi:hypothetical protein
VARVLARDADEARRLVESILRTQEAWQSENVTMVVKQANSRTLEDEYWRPIKLKVQESSQMSTEPTTKDQARKGKLWTETEVTQLKTEAAQGTPLETIAATHGRTLVAIDCKLAQVGKTRVDAGELPENVQKDLRYTDAAYKKVCTPKKPKKVAAAAPPPAPAPVPVDEAMMVHIFKRSYADYQAQVSMLGADNNEARKQTITVLFALLKQHIDAYEAAVLFKQARD